MQNATSVATESPSNLFKDAEIASKAEEVVNEHNRRIDLLITPKNHERLRAFGYAVVQVADALPPKTTDRRSL